MTPDNGKFNLQRSIIEPGGAKAVISAAVLCGLLSASFLFLHPDKLVLAPYAVAVFFQHEMSTYVRDHMAVAPPALSLFANVAFVGMFFEYGFLAFVWYRFGLGAGAAIFVTAFMISVTLSIAVRMTAGRAQQDTLMFINFAGLVGLPVAAVFAIARAM